MTQNKRLYKFKLGAQVLNSMRNSRCRFKFEIKVKVTTPLHNRHEEKLVDCRHVSFNKRYTPPPQKLTL